MEWTLAAAAIALLTAGLVGQGFEMRRINRAREAEGADPAGVFADRRNVKWYAMIGAGILLWLAAERL